MSIPEDMPQTGSPGVDTPFRGNSDPDNDRGPAGPSCGNLTSRLRAGVPLSNILYASRPLLRPIEFVRSVHSATLFQQEEDVVVSTKEEIGEYLWFSIMS